MKPPARKTGSFNARNHRKSSAKTNKRKRLCSRSPHEIREVTRTNACAALSPAAPNPLLSPPSFNLSGLVSCAESIKYDVISSTPMAPDSKKCGCKVHHAFMNAVETDVCSCLYTSSLFDLSNSQACGYTKLCVTSSSVPGMGSFMTTPSKKSPRDNLKLSEWGIPNLVLEQYAKRGITSMYEWQAECLMIPGVLEGGNLVFSAPTSAGKTFIAELLALKCVLESKKKVIIILPFVSIAHEKANYLQSIFEPNGVKVGGFMGGHSPSGGFAAVDIAICTIEKANSLVNRLLEEGSICEIGAVVIDELHMIGDSHRGYLLELLLTKLLYICKRTKVDRQACLAVETSPDKIVHGKSAIQIVGMSATLPNLNVLSDWLEGQLYSTNYRPVPLQEMVKVGPTLFDTKFEKIRDLRSSESTNDEEDILNLCEETVTNGHSVLIFCPTKQWCETLAGVISQAPFFQKCAVPGGADSDQSENGKEEPSHFRLQLGALRGVIEQLRRTQVGLDEILGKTVPCGVGFHHAGLTFDEREIVEGAFRQSQIRVLVATSTLSSGVNLPARLVIVRTPFFQRSLLDVLVYKQMVGRAGRKGVDERGESVLICKPSEQSMVRSLFQCAPKPVTSCLDLNGRKGGKGNDVSAFRRALLEIVTSGEATSQAEVETYLKCTLLYSEKNRPPQEKTSHSGPPSQTHELIRSTIDYLMSNEFITPRNKQPPPNLKEANIPCPGGGDYHATQLGAATVASALSPEEALIVFHELRKARRNFVLESELHIIYLVTPVYVQEQWPSIDWYRFLCLLERLPADIRHVANTLGVQESFLAGAVQGRIPERTAAQQERLRVHRRFYTALALHDLVHEAPIVYVARKYNVSKGLLQTLQSAAGTFSGMVTVFCSRLGWKNLELLLSQFQSRLSFGVERELCDLVSISLLNGFRARALYNAGFHSLSALATANPMAIEHCLRNAVPFKSSKGAEESNHEPIQRKCTTWCAKLRRGMTEYEAACEIVCEAQKILSEQMNLPLSAWRVVEIKDPVQRVMVEPNVGSSKDRLSCQRKRPHPSEDLASKDTNEASKQTLGTEDDQNFKTPKQSKNLCQRKIIGKMTHMLASSPIILSAADMPSSSKKPLPIHLPLPLVGLKEDSISYSPIYFQNSQSLLHTPLPLELLEQPSIPTDSLSLHICATSDHPLTVPNSLPCSLDMSNSFSCATLAMIDAACQDNSLNNMSHSIISATGDMEEDRCKHVTKVVESPALLGDSPVLENMAMETEVNRAISKPEFVSEQSSISDHQVNNIQVSHNPPTAVISAIPHADTLSSQSRLRDLSQIGNSQVSFTQSGACVIEVTSNTFLFETFVTECLEQISLSFSIAVASLNQVGTIGIKTVESQSHSGIPIPHRSEQIVGVALCWGSMDVYYVSLCNNSVATGSAESIPLASRVEALCSIFQSPNCKEVISYSFKKNLKLFASVFGIFPTAKSLDPQVADWMLNPDGKEKTIHKMVLHYLPDQPLLSEGEDYEDMPLSNLATHGSEPRIQAAAEVLLASLLSSKMRPILEEEGLWESFLEVEMPTLVVLTRMELNGIGFSKEECDALKHMLQLRLVQIETEAYSHAQRSFSLTSPEDVARVLFFELQLQTPSEMKQQKTLGPNRRGKKRLQHLSTAKDVLEKLESVHPLPGLILEWRRISSTVTKTVFPLFKDAVCHSALNSVRVHSTYHIHTATGRVATSDPNLQMVPKEYGIGSKTAVSAMLMLKGSVVTDVGALLSESRCFHDACGEETREGASEQCESQQSSVNMRSVFVPFAGGVFLAADYSQLELRVLAHMSGDEKLQRVLNSEGDVFKMIAGEWLGVPASHVRAEERQQAKQICYGMVYGIGAKALSEQLKVTVENAAQFMETFKSKYPTMKRFIANTVQSCKEKGYIVTLLGRKRYLSGIHSQNVHARSQAERQAVNSTIQGSAADLVKTAMINIDLVLAKEYNSSPPFLTYSTPDHGSLHTSEPSGSVRGAYLVLQLHDELLYEVCEKDLPRVADVVQYQMEHALQLSVRFPVKVQVGSSWGNLKPYSNIH